MSEIGRWNGHKFEVSASLVRGFTGLTIKGSSETEDKDANGEKYVSRKGGKPKEIKLDALLAASLGCDVRTEALQFVNEATSGTSGYFYVGNKKLVICQLMLTEASVKDVKIVGNGTWTSATVSLTMKQCTKNDAESPPSGGTPSGGGGSSQRVSVNTTPPVKAVVTSAATAAAVAVNSINRKNAAVVTSTATAAVKAAASAVKNISSAAKSATATSKSSTANSGTAKTVISNIFSSLKEK